MQALPDALPFPPDAVEVGRIVGAWGIKGAIKVQPFAADPQALFSTKRWFLKAPQLQRPALKSQAAALPAMLHVQTAREQGDMVVATALEVADRDAAEALRGARIFVARSSFPTPGDDEFYWVDLIGLAVSNRQGEALGSVVGLIETGPHCVLRLQVDGDGNGEVLIPFVAAYVDEVDLPGRRIRVDWDAADT